MANTIQQRFLHLLQVTSALFTAQHSSAKEERSAFDGARAAALALVSEAKQPSFEHFLAYLLGVTSIDGDYPLQAIRMLALTAQVIARQPPAPDLNLDDLYTAAYIADLGFRPSWIGQKGSHAEVAAYRIKGISFPWFNLVVEKLIMGHHHFASDVSPQHCLSLIARYLGLVYDLGTDDTANNHTAPAKALEILLQEHPTAVVNIKFILKSISAFPLGSWVLLSTGDPAFVIGTNPDNPLRPKVGYCRKSNNGAWMWEEHLLQNEPTVHITSDLSPTAQQQSFINQPHLWIKGWDGQGTFSDAEFTEMFRHRTEPKNAAKTPAPPATGTEPVWLMKPPAPSSASEGSGAPGPLSPNVSDKELQKLRTEWETNVHQIEECVTKLKTGLIESYRRENERYREALEQLANKPVALSAAMNPVAPEPQPGILNLPSESEENISSALLGHMQGILQKINAETEYRQNQLKIQDEDLQQSLNSVKTFFEAGLSAVSRFPADQGTAIRNVLVKALAEINSAEQSLLRSLDLPIASLSELRAQQEAARALSEKFQGELGRGSHSPSIEDRYTRQWNETFETQLEKWRQTVERDWMDRLERGAKLKQLIQQFQDLMNQLKDKFPDLN